MVLSVVVSWNSPVLVFSVPALQRSVLPSAGAMQAYSSVQIGAVETTAYEAEKEVVIV